MKRTSLIAVLLTVAAVAAWMWFSTRGKKPPAPGAPIASVDTGPPSTSGAAARLTSSVAPGMPAVRTTAAATSAALVAVTSVGGEAATSRLDAQAEATSDLEKVRFMLRDFRTRMGENPVGSNAEIMRAIMGGNTAGATLGPPPGQGLNAEGELVDRWDTPYFFHQLSRDKMEIRSAGPDRQMWTPDDVATK